MLSLVNTQNVHIKHATKLKNLHVNGREPVCALNVLTTLSIVSAGKHLSNTYSLVSRLLISNIGQPPMYRRFRFVSVNV